MIYKSADDEYIYNECVSERLDMKSGWQEVRKSKEICRLTDI